MTPLVAGMVAGMVVTPAAVAHADPNPPPAAGQTASVTPDGSRISSSERDKVLPKNWQKSEDTAWTTSGDADGFHVLAASARDGYAWHTVATLGEPGLDADQWIGNACLTGSGRRLVVVYAPRTFTNRPDLFDRGGFTAVVDLVSGAVTKLPVTGSLAYFNPGCGAGESSVVSQFRADESTGARQTRLFTVDTAHATVGAPVQVAGELSSPIPVGSDIVAAAGHDVVQVGSTGRMRRLAESTGTPFRLTPDADGGVAFMDHLGDQARVRRTSTRPGAGVKTLASGRIDQLGLTPGAAGQTFLTGTPAKVAALPSSMKRVAVPRSTVLSSTGQLALTSVGWAGKIDPRTPVPAASVRPLAIQAKVLATGKQLDFTVTPQPAGPADAGLLHHPSIKPTAPKQPHMAAAPSTDPVDNDRWCSVPRNDVHNQVLQPKPRQVEWAVDQAVMNSLNFTRPANWKNDGLPAYSPQGLFPSIDLIGGGHVPPQIMLGIATQESNLWQASPHALPGEMGNPLIGNFYGTNVYDADPSNDWDIHWDRSDCGYGVTQVTDGMRLAGHAKSGETPYPYTTQRAVALDYTVNIAAGLQILEKKWNETRQAGLVVNDGSSYSLENWFFALWAYNSGFHPSTGSGPWGVGWGNNPANPRFDPQRRPFLEYTYDDARNPQYWPYEEKVLGWAGHPINSVESPDVMVAGYRPAWWDSVDDRISVKPPMYLFCDDSDDCKPGQKFTPDKPDDPSTPGDDSTIGEPAGPCAHRDSHGYYDLMCWYHKPVTWKGCPGQCGNEVLRFDPGYAYQDDGASYKPNCGLSGLPAGALIIDDLPDPVPPMRDADVNQPCKRSYTSAGSFALTFNTDSAGNATSKIDTHQLGAGFNGHFWFAHTHHPGADGDRFKVTGAWTLGQQVNGPARVLVHLPDSGAQTNRAVYEISTGSGTRTRVVHQSGSTNRWVSLGAFMFSGTPTVRLSNVTDDGRGSDDIAWDAVAFQPIQGTIVEHTVAAVALFDEDQNLQTAFPASWLSTPFATRQSLYDWGIKESTGVTNLSTCASGPASGCAMPGIKQAMATWNQHVTAAGTDPVNHPDGESEADWINFANPYTYRPTGPSMPAHFNTDDSSFKVREQAQVSFVKGPDGKIVDGSEYVAYDNRTGDTHLPEFVLDTFKALESDYGIARPDLTYTTPDLNTHDGQQRTATPQVDGVMPGRSYAYAGKAPVVTDDNANPTAGGTCVAALYTAGGSIGYRPMLGVARVSQQADAWRQRVKNNPAVPAAVASVADEIYNAFFKGGLTGSIFGQAPPIWQELNFRACTDGSIRQNSGRPVLRSSHMPDQYLYHNGVAIGVDGKPTGQATPVVRGNFEYFSRVADPNKTFPLWPNPNGACDAATGQSGNPWDISNVPPQDAGTDPPHGHFCVDKTLPSDSNYSS